VSDADIPVALELRHGDMPALFISADAGAIFAQKRYFRLVQGQIACLLLATLAATLDAALDGQAWLAYVSIGAFMGLAILRIYQRWSGYETQWYEGRAGAESLKTLTWRYTVGVEPFELELSAVDADRLFLRRIQESLASLSPQLFIRGGEIRDQITPAMRQMRAASFDVRRESYLVGRVEDQAVWYVTKAQSADVKGRWWDFGFLVACGLAVVLGLLRITGAMEVNIISIAAIAAAVIATWVGVRRYAETARTYSYAAQELLAVRSELPGIGPDEWSQFVDDAENAISKEHTLWIASRS
jgi:hypothetical protein